ATIRLYDTTGRLLSAHRVTERERTELTWLAFAKDGREILYAGIDFANRTGMFDLTQGRSRVAFPKHDNTIFHGSLSPDGALAVTTGGDDNQTYVWRTADGSLVHKLQSGGRSVWGVGWSRDRKAIAWGNTNGAGTLTGTTRLERTFPIGDLDFGPPPTPGFLRHPAEVNGYTLHGLDFFRIAIKRHGAQIHVFQAPLKGDRLYSAALIGDDRAAFGGSFGTIYIVDLKPNQRRY